MITLLSAEAQCMIKQELGSNEKVLWCKERASQPIKKGYLGRITWALLLIADVKYVYSLWPSLWAFFFLLIGVWLLFAHPFSPKNMQPTVYVLTANRALIFVAGGLRIFDKSQLVHAALTLRLDGRGDVIFEVFEEDGPDGDGGSS